MLDDLTPDVPRVPREGQRPSQSRARKDREVKPVVERDVPETGRRLSSEMHAWLDGELPEAAARAGDTESDVEFWRTVSKRMERSRLVRTPEHVEAQIMAALPHHPPQLISPWYRREFVITPVAAVSVGVALMAVAAAATALLLAP
jgi:hypothetical protein